MAGISIPVAPGGCRVACRLGGTRPLAAARRAPVPPPPHAVKMQLTSRCNLRCAGCPSTLDVHERGEMRWPLFTRLVGEIVDAGVKELGFFYLGEPFLYDWLPDAIEYAKARGIEYAFVTTNGVLATPERVRQCLDGGLDALQFAMNYADEDHFRALARVQGELIHDAVFNLQCARRVRDEGGYGCAIVASSVIYAAEEAERMQQLVGGLLPYVDEHYWLPPHATDRVAAARLPQPCTRPVPCATLFTEAHVTFDGKLSACRFEAGPRWIVADLAEASFLEGWCGAKYAALRQAHLSGKVAGTPCDECRVHR